MSYAPKDLIELAKARSTVGQRTLTLQTSLLGLNLSDARAKEFASHGVGRRLGIMSRCISNVFAAVPPDTTLPPQSEALLDANINLQAFVFNLFGAIDNLAWVWVLEKKVKEVNGKDIRPMNIGLRPNDVNKSVLSQMPTSIQLRVKEFEEWFKNLDSFRHSLGHRIPLYIPPYSVLRMHEEEYQALGQKMSDALKSGDEETYDQLVEQQERLGTFQGLALHSFSEDTKPMRFHAQMLADFSTIEDLILRFVEALGGAAKAT